MLIHGEDGQSRDWLPMAWDLANHGYACMLISLWTGKKPTLRTYEMICWYFMGMADLEELLAHIAKLKKQDA